MEKIIYVFTRGPKILFFDNAVDLQNFISTQDDEKDSYPYYIKEFDVSHLYDGDNRKPICFMREQDLYYCFDNITLTTKEDFYNNSINHIKSSFNNVEYSYEDTFKYVSSFNDLFKIITCKFYNCGSNTKSGMYFELFYDINFNLINP